MSTTSSPRRSQAHPTDNDRLLNGIRDLLLASDRARHHMATVFRLTLTDLAALSHLGTCDNLGQRQIAQRLGLTASATTALLDRLETLDLARREPHPADRRRIQVNLTQGGRERIKDVRKLYASALAAVPSADLAHATNFLEQLSTELARAVINAGG